MIAKIGRGANLFGVLSYNTLKVDKEEGRILYLNNVADTWDGRYSVSQLAHSFEPYLLANNKTEKPILHISLNPDPLDQVTDEQFIRIAEEYMKEMGYQNQPFVVFKHTDIDRSHIHIVSVCVDEEGKKISDKFEKMRSMSVCRALESKYGLIPATDKERQQNGKIFRPVDYREGDVKSQIASIIRHLPNYYKFQSFGEYNALLSLFNITAEKVTGQINQADKKGVVYFALNKNAEKCSNPFKSSLFGKGAGYNMLQQHFKKSADALQKEPGRMILKDTIKLALHMATNEITFHNYLLEQGINIVIRKNTEGRIYGITFVDHNTRIVCNGSRMGKELSAGVFNEWWKNDRKPQNTTTAAKPISKTVAATASSTAGAEPNNLFDFLMKDDFRSNDTLSGFIESLGGLLPEKQGEDFEELDFENKIKRKLRKKKNG